MHLDVSFLAAVLVGFLGGVHCVGMCGGIVGALSFALPQHKRAVSHSWHYLLAYNLARIGSYTLAGGLVGGIGLFTLKLFNLHQLQQYLFIVSGVFMILLGLYLAGWWRVLVHLERAGGVVWRKLEPLGRAFLPVTTHRQAFALGAVWGWLPCGLVYSVLIWALASGSPLQGAWLMLGFGLGTLPNLMAMGLFAATLNRFMRQPWTRWLAGSVIIALGVWQILRLQA